MIEVGEYVRTKRGIAKVLEVKTVQPKMYGQHDVAYLIDKCPRMYITETAFIKHSKNIIDLIEAGDIVFIEDFSGYDFIYINDKEMLEALKQDVKDGVRIKSILTKQLYQANCYTVERKEKC